MDKPEIQKVLRDRTILKQSNEGIIKILNHLSECSYVPEAESQPERTWRASVKSIDSDTWLIGFSVTARTKDEAYKKATKEMFDRMDSLNVEYPHDGLKIYLFS